MSGVRRMSKHQIMTGRGRAAQQRQETPDTVLRYRGTAVQQDPAVSGADSLSGTQDENKTSGHRLSQDVTVLLWLGNYQYTR